VTWSLERAEEHLLSLELFGMRFGLERMRRLLTALGSPQERLRAIHVVGTNGKSSTVRFAAALLEANGVRTGAYLSPHLTSFAERIRVGGEDVSADAFGAAVQRAAAAAAKVDRTLSGGERVTQFELLTAAALDELARAGVEAAVIEAGLGGRYDATNVLDAPVCVLTNVGLEHTKWLGPTIADIAREKLAVVKRSHPPATLVLGDDDPEVEALARETGAEVVRPRDADVPATGYQRANYLLALEAAQRFTGGQILHSSIDVNVPGRLQTIAEDPLTIVDGAHNPAGMVALAGALDDVVGERRLVAVVSVLDDKDAAGMLRALLGKCAAVVFTASQNPRALPPATLASLAGQLGGWESHVVHDPRTAVARARELAGPDGAVLATGSIYLVADLLRDPSRRRASAL
jgi:dihydrofolate synthase/folylpolyglutamate synthase